MINIKACNKNKDFLLSCFIMCLILFNCSIFFSCGLDTFYYIEAPKTDTMPNIDDNGIDKQSFIFNTNVSSDDFTHLSTDVYYKIYSERSDWEREVNSLTRIANDDLPNSVDSLVFPDGGGGYGFQRLRTSVIDDSLVQGASGSQKIEIRLTNSNVDAYKAHVKIDGHNAGVPLRYNGKTFDFGQGQKGKNKPDTKNGFEKDVKYKGSVYSGDKWYVALFAASSGLDQSYVKHSSNITYLGSVTIDSSKEFN